MPLRTTHIAQKLKAAATLLLLLLCVCSAVARDTTRVFSKLPWDANTAGGANGLGGAYTNEYNYDGLYRLTAANGSYAGNNTNYSLEMSYTPAGRLCSKLQDFTGTGNVYAYSPNNKQHAVRRIYNGLTNELSNLRWDNNGNLAQQTLYSVNNNVPAYQNMRALYWDEDDRLNLVAGDGYLSYYAYGHDGNRAIKMTGNATIDQTGTLLNSTNLENITIYPNEYLTVTQGEYTKYYYAGGNRIASKIGTGGFEKMTRLCTEDLFFSGNANTLFGSVILQVTNTANQPNDEYPVNVCGGYNVATELLTNPLPDFYISQTNLNFTQNNLLQQFRQNLTGGIEPVYYFHSDHLGSASWITNNTGLPVQHLLYLPFGEHFVNEQSTGYNERFTFTGKEKDIETGYYYFGARFDNVDLGFMSVDPMADKYPSISPYAYCAWNPVKLVDPDGETGVPVIDKNKKTITVYSKLYFFGSGATTELSKKIATGIAKQWNSANAKYTIDGEKYSVKFRISYETVSEEKARKLANNNTDPKNNFIRVAKGPKGKSSLTYQNGNSFWFNTDDDLEESTTPAHEYGHGLGLKHPNEDLSNETERPHIMIPRKKPYGEKWSIFIDGKQVVNPDKRIVTEKNVQEALDNNCGKMNNVIFNEDGSH